MKWHLGLIWFGLFLAIMSNGCINLEKNGAAEESGTEYVEYTESIVQTETQMTETEQDNEQSYYGTWEVKDYQSARVSSLSKEDIETFLDYTITYQADMVLQNGKDVNISDFGYEYQDYTEEMIVQIYNVNLGEWWDSKPQVLGVSVTTSEIFFGSQFFVADDETLWIYYEGVFFLAKAI